MVASQPMTSLENTLHIHSTAAELLPRKNYANEQIITVLAPNCTAQPIKSQRATRHVESAPKKAPRWTDRLERMGGHRAQHEKQ